MSLALGNIAKHVYPFPFNIGVTEGKNDFSDPNGFVQPFWIKTIITSDLWSSALHFFLTFSKDNPVSAINTLTPELAVFYHIRLRKPDQTSRAFIQSKNSPWTTPDDSGRRYDFQKSLTISVKVETIFV